MNKNPIVYVDLGGSRISAIAGYVQDDNFLHIIGEQNCESNEIKNGIVINNTNAAFKLNKITKLLQNSLKMEQIRLVSISVNARSMKHYAYTVEHQIYNFVTSKLLEDMEKICSRELQTDKTTVFQCIPLAYYIDGVREDNPVGKRGEKLRVDFNVIIGNYAVQETIERTIERTGLAVDYIHLGMEAMATVLLDEEQKNNGCALISFGATTTTLGVYSEGILQKLCVIPFGGANITQDIQELGISNVNAERLKCKMGYAREKSVEAPVRIRIPNVQPNAADIEITSTFLATIIEARLEEILEPIFNQIDQIHFPLRSGIVITGGACKLLGLTDFICDHTGLQVRIGKHADWLSDETDPKFQDPMYSQAVGALLMTNDLLEKQSQNIEIAIETKIPSKNPLKKLTEKVTVKLTNTMIDLFGYDELEQEQEDTKVNEGNKTEK